MYVECVKLILTSSSSRMRLKPFRDSFESDELDTDGHILVRRTLILQVVREVSNEPMGSNIAPATNQKLLLKYSRQRLMLEFCWRYSRSL